MSIHRCATVCGLSLVFTISSVRADWTISNVEVGTNVGFATSLAIDAAGVPHVAYFRPASPPFEATFSDLNYATRSGSTWFPETIVEDITNGTQGSATSIAVTELGTPAVSFTRSSTFVRYSIRTAGAWITPIVVSNAGGGYSSLVWQGTEASPTPKIAYNNSATNALKFASMAAGTFTSQDLDNAIAAGASISLAQFDTFVGVAFIDGNKLGFWNSPNSGMNWGQAPGTNSAPFSTLTTGATVCALAVAPTTDMTNNSNPVSAHILYFDIDDSAYKYITNDTDTGTWTIPEVVFQSGLVTITQSGCSIAVDSAGVIHAAFLDFASKRLGYETRTSAGWSAVDFVEGAALGGAYCTIRMNAQGQPAIAYSGLVFDGMNYVTNGVRYAEFGPSPGVGVLSFAITGKAKRTTSKSSLTVKGTASAAATSIQWRVGKGKFRSKTVSAGKWSIKVTKLVAGTNTVEFRARNAQGQFTATKKVKIIRK